MRRVAPAELPTPDDADDATAMTNARGDASTVPASTVVVGVGGAGIDVLTRLAESDGLGWGAEYDDRFDYVAVDTDPTDLRRAPDGAATVHLDVSSQAFATARERTPYLAATHRAPDDGTRNQRAVGRYALARHVDTLVETFARVFESHLDPPDDAGRTSRQRNIVHVHSMGGGTGSGTFPLVAALLDRVTTDLYGRSNDVYTAGVGIVPELAHDIDQATAPNERRYYANTYAALRDLERLLVADTGDPLPINRYESGPDDPTTAVDEREPHVEVDESPYRHYFLVGVDEHRLAGSHEQAGVESYLTAVDNSIVAAIYGLAALGDDVITWFPPPADTAHVGAIDQTQLSIPIERVRTYCELTERIASLRADPDRPDADLDAARAARAELRDELSTGAHGQRLGRLALDEAAIREELDRETLEADLTSLAAFRERGLLARELSSVMVSRLRQAYAWRSPPMRWTDDPAIERLVDRPRAYRAVWMLHSDENAALPSVEPFDAGRHAFRRTGPRTSFPSFSDPYTVQFLTYYLDAPLSDLRIYDRLHRAAGDRLDAVLDDWPDHRVAFAYPEWYGRGIRRYFDILTAVDLPRLPELDLSSVRIEREGDALVTWLSSYGLASYLWQADEWSRYDGFITNGSDRLGWRQTLAGHDLTYQDLRRAVPNGEPVARWVDGGLSWSALLTRVEHALAEREGIRVRFVDVET